MIATGERAVIRAFQVQDIDLVVELFRNSVRTLGPLAYAKEQVDMWAAHPLDIAEFCQRLCSGKTLVVDAEQHLLAFAQLSPSDHIAFLYCRGSAARQGWCSRLYQLLETEALNAGVSTLRTEASRLSRPFFEKHGFVVESPEFMVRFGVSFERFRMTKKLALPQRLPLNERTSEILRTTASAPRP